MSNEKHAPSTAADNDPPHSFLNHRQIRAPQNHGEVLHLPPENQWRRTWNKNIADREFEPDFHSDSFEQIHKTGRQELLAQAIQFTRQYRDIEIADRDHSYIAMSGHQPGLFHPGVWYKNFILSKFAQKMNCIAINLVVDTDLCNSSHVNIPSQVKGSDKLHYQRIQFDDNRYGIAFEDRKILNRELFSGFEQRLKSELSPWVSDPIIEKLWPHVIENSSTGNLGVALSCGRHRLEQDLGLQTLELPISLVSESIAFVAFLKEMLIRHDELKAIYNSTIKTYRSIHKIKNPAQPIPELSNRDSWIETPFWALPNDSTSRNSIYSRFRHGKIEVSDLKTFEFSFETRMPPADIREHLLSNIRIRPKALMTTMFNRLITGDLFIHGIGGAKYDQLTDQIAFGLFKQKLPKYITVSGTFQMLPNVPRIRSSDLSTISHRLRELKFHPEKFIDQPDEQARHLIQQKMRWVNEQPPFGQRLARHHAINDANKDLQSFVDDLRIELKDLQSTLVGKFSNSKIMGSRELSFCIHESGLMNDLSKTASAAFDNAPADE